MQSQPVLTKRQFDAFGTCLAPELSLPQISALRVWFLSSIDNLARLIEFAASRDLLPAFEYCLSRYALVPPDGRGRDDAISPSAYFRSVRKSHVERRAAMRRHLIAAVHALNAQGIEPLLLKGCASLWEERDSWRQMRDIDILVRPEETRIAHDVLIALGFRESPDAAGQRFGHHLPPLIREGMPGWLEVHFRGSNQKAEKYLPTRKLWAASMPSERDGGRVDILPAPQQVMHGLIHNHFGHRSSSFGTINLKGLQEFTWAVAAMGADDQQALDALSLGSTRLRAASELWVSAAGFYHLGLPAGWSVSADARARADDALARAASGAQETLVTTFVKTASQDLGRSGSDGEGSKSWSGRFAARLKVIGAAAREIVVPWRNRASLRDKSAGIRR